MSELSAADRLAWIAAIAAAVEFAAAQPSPPRSPRRGTVVAPAL